MYELIELKWSLWCRGCGYEVYTISLGVVGGTRGHSSPAISVSRISELRIWEDLHFHATLVMVRRMMDMDIRLGSQILDNDMYS